MPVKYQIWRVDPVGVFLVGENRADAAVLSAEIVVEIKLIVPEYDRLVTVTPDGPEKFIPMGDLTDEVLSLAPVREMDSWLTDLEGGRPHAVRAEQAAAVVRVIETMYESARQGRTIRLD